MRLTLVLLIITTVLPLQAYATEFNHTTLKTIIDRFSALDHACDQMVESSAAEEKGGVNKFRSELYMAIAVLNGIDTSPNEKFAEPIKDYSKVLSDVLKEVSRKQSIESNNKRYERPPGDLMAIPMITMGIGMAVMSPEGVALSDNEREDLLETIENAYEHEAMDKDSVKGKNPFAVSVLLIDDLLRRVK